MIKSNPKTVLARIVLVWLFVGSVPLALFGQEKDQTNLDRAKLLSTFRLEFVEVSPGKKDFRKAFTMGSDREPNEGPVRTVTMQEPFFVAKYEVPQDLWQAVMGSNPSTWGGPRNSVEQISFDDAVNFCKRATELMRSQELITDKQIIRLPTEAEWEYFARAGTQTAYSFGKDASQINDYAWHTGNAAGNDPPVGAKKPNAWGLYDIHGYLWEWCEDPWHDNYKNAPTDGSAWTKDGDAKRRVLRGGSWKDKADKLTSSYRQVAPATTKDDAIGLRCVLANREARTEK